MEEKLLAMSVQELKDTMVKIDREGEKLCETTNAYIDKFNEVKEDLPQERIDKAYRLIAEARSRLETLARARALSKLILERKYGVFIM